MKFTSRSIVCGFGLVAGLAVLVAPAQAQNADTQANPLADFQTQNNDPFSGQGDANSSMMNLMQRIMQGERPDPAAFAASQQENMNDAMANFRAKQMQLIKARQAQPAALTVAPTVGTTATAQSATPLACYGMRLPFGTTCIADPKTGEAMVVPAAPTPVMQQK
jgi:hypothetical protein